MNVFVNLLFSSTVKKMFYNQNYLFGEIKIAQG